jgi:hypothetical protein
VTKQADANKKKHVNLTVPWKLEVIRRFGSGKAEVWLWLHMALDCQTFYVVKKEKD